MAETEENIRFDKGVREQKQKEITDWSGRRLVLPRGTTLPAVDGTRLPDEVFVFQRAGASDQLFVFDSGINNWTTVGPRP